MAIKIQRDLCDREIGETFSATATLCGHIGIKETYEVVAKTSLVTTVKKISTDLVDISKSSQEENNGN